MKFAERVDRVAGDGASAWDVHYQALRDQERDKEVLVLSVGDPNFSTPPAIITAAIGALQNGDSHYTPILGRDPLRDAIADEFSRTSGVTSSVSNVAVLAGAQNALFTASLCILNPGDEVCVFDPMYLTYEAYIGVSGASVRRVTGLRSENFRPCIKRLRESINPNTRAIAFSNPNNPSGVVMSQVELEAIAAIAIENDLWVIADEVYSTLTFEKSHLSIASIEGMKERTITVSSLSKSHAMTGWRLGWMIAPTELISHVENMALCMLYGLPGFIQQAGIEALTHSRTESDEMRQIYQSRRDIVCDALASIEGLSVLSPEAGMFVLIDISKTGINAAEFTERLYAKQKVAVLDGGAFGSSIANCIRLSFTNDETALLEACQRIKLFMSSL